MSGRCLLCGRHVDSVREHLKLTHGVASARAKRAPQKRIRTAPARPAHQSRANLPRFG